jgi:hypothetical protein
MMRIAMSLIMERNVMHVLSVSGVVTGSITCVRLRYAWVVEKKDIKNV